MGTINLMGANSEYRFVSTPSANSAMVPGFCIAGISFLSWQAITNAGTPTSLVFPLAGLLIIGIMYFFFWRRIEISIDDAGIEFRRGSDEERINWKEIKSIDEPSRKSHLGSLSGVTRIKLLNGEVIDIMYENYSNSREMLGILSRANVYRSKGEIPTDLFLPQSVPINTITDSDLQAEEFQEFTGDPVRFVFNSLVIPAGIGIAYVAYREGSIIPIILLFSLFSVSMCFVSYYYSVSENFFLVENQFIPWFQRVIRFADIRSIIFEKRYHGRGGTTN